MVPGCTVSVYIVNQLVSGQIDHQMILFIAHVFPTFSLDVEAEVKRNKWLERQRPEYRTTTTKCYSLRDPIVPDEHSAARQKLWLDIHSKLAHLMSFSLFQVFGS